jgi:hypothetical protein
MLAFDTGHFILYIEQADNQPPVPSTVNGYRK